MKNPAKPAGPAWHETELQIREERLTKGLTHFSNWSEAKQRIHESLSSSKPI